MALCGCAINPNSDVNAFAERTSHNSFEVSGRRFDSPQALVLPVVHDRQYDGPSCGAHVLASVVNYWRGPGAVTGDAIYRQTPPAAPSGYSMAELLTLAQSNGLLASAVRMPREALIAELERGRPVLVPVRLPSIYVQKRIMPGGDVPVWGLARNTLVYRAGRVSEWTGLAMVNHYLLVVGYNDDAFVVIEPVMGYRTIHYPKFERYRQAFGDAAIVFSGTTPVTFTQDRRPQPQLHLQ